MLPEWTTSVLVAYLFTMLPEWTTWVLVALIFVDVTFVEKIFAYRTVMVLKMDVIFEGQFLDGEDGRKPCISSLAAVTSVGSRKAEFVSARQSVSVRRSTVQRSAVNRSMSGIGNAWYCGQYVGKVCK
ncbi:hypothetical protein SUGI_1007200 [Cryptomeria japonica]|nr:hypothetical protein SUGI_1007200 [Cryptomeria japonica]